jgi:hypothetical protein
LRAEHRLEHERVEAQRRVVEIRHRLHQRLQHGAQQRVVDERADALDHLERQIDLDRIEMQQLKVDLARRHGRCRRRHAARETERRIVAQVVVDRVREVSGARAGRQLDQRRRRRGGARQLVERQRVGKLQQNEQPRVFDAHVKLLHQKRRVVIVVDRRVSARLDHAQVEERLAARALVLQIRRQHHTKRRRVELVVDLEARHAELELLAQRRLLQTHLEPCSVT